MRTNMLTRVNLSSRRGALSTAGFGAVTLGNGKRSRVQAGVVQAGWEHAWGKSQRQMDEAALSSGSATHLAETQRHLSL